MPKTPPLALRRLVCVSTARPVCSARDLIDVCLAYPEPFAQTGVRAKVLGIGEQYVVLLEGPDGAAQGMAEQLIRRVPQAGLTVRSDEAVGEFALRTWAIEDLYLDEIARQNPAAGEEMTDLLIDLLSDRPAADPASDESAEDQAEDQIDGEEQATEEAPVDPFVAVAELAERYAVSPYLKAAAAAAA